ncbi:MAG: tetratricopeptide repeat protein [Anaerolineales bacterium]
MSEEVLRLEAELATTTTREPRLRIELLNELAWLLCEADLGRAIALSQEARRLGEELAARGEPYDEGLARTLHHLGRFYMWSSDFGSAISYFSQARLLYEQLEDLEAVAAQISYIGSAYGRSGNYAEGLRYLIEAQEMLAELHDRNLEAQALNDIGYTYVLTGRPAEALPYLEKSLEIYRDFENIHGQSLALDSLCRAHLDLGHLDDALACGLESLSCAGAGGLRRAESLLAVGEVYLALQNDLQALNYFQQSLAIALEQQYRCESAQARERIGQIYRRQGRLEDAVLEMQLAVETAHAIGSAELEAQAHRSLARVYHLQEDDRKALAHLETYHALQEQVFNEETDRRLQTLQVAYEAESARREAVVARAQNVALQEEIQERHLAEQALQQTNARLEEEIAAHQELIADLDAFAHMVAHDLKNPIHTIAGFSEVLQERLADRNDVLLVEFVGIIHETALQMGRIIDTMLLLARMREEEVQGEVVEMGPLVEAAERRLSRMLQESHGAIVKPEFWPVAWGYGPWVEEVWENYLSNALKYGGRPPRVEVGATVQPEGCVKFWVRDNGPGFSAQQAERLFKPFSQLQKGDRRGHGLGLSIVKRIVDKLGGKVGVESAPVGGSTFYFTLPTAPDSAVEQGRGQ